MKRMEYTLDEFPSRDTFVTRVNDRLEKNWMLHGPTSVIYVPGVGKIYSQAFVREIFGQVDLPT